MSRVSRHGRLAALLLVAAVAVAIVLPAAVRAASPSASPAPSAPAGGGPAWYVGRAGHGSLPESSSTEPPPG